MSKFAFKLKINGREYSDAEQKALQATLKNITSDERSVAEAASRDFVQAVDAPLREVLLSGDLINGIYVPGDFQTNNHVMYQLDLLSPGTERDYFAYSMPDHGEIPQRRVEGDYLMINVFKIANSIDATLQFLEDANWGIVARMLEIMEAGVVKKINDDGWQTILAAATDRNILVNDPNAAAGQFTPRLVTLMKSFMRRNGGGNSATPNKFKLTDFYISPEGKDDIRAWGLDLIPDAARANIYYSSDEGAELMRVFDVNIHDLYELGVDQEYQTYFTGTLGGALAASDTELGVGLDLTNKANTFVRPIRKAWQTFEDPKLHREGLFGYYGWMRHGFAVLDSRRTMLASF